MNPSDYTEEQKRDIEDRVEKAKQALSDLKLQPGVAMQMVNIGDDTFAVKPIPYLQDTAFTPQKSPIQDV